MLSDRGSKKLEFAKLPEEEATSLSDLSRKL